MLITYPLHESPGYRLGRAADLDQLELERRASAVDGKNPVLDRDPRQLLGPLPLDARPRHSLDHLVHTLLVVPGNTPHGHPGPGDQPRNYLSRARPLVHDRRTLFGIPNSHTL